MKRYLIIIFLFSFSIGCHKDEIKEEFLTDGIYIGTFQRELSWTNNYKANITMTFSSKSWTGNSDMNKYPALCHGTYSIINDTIVFLNDCAWTTEFDWNLILQGKYRLNIQGDSVEIYREYPRTEVGLVTDRYKIKRQEK